MLQNGVGQVVKGQALAEEFGQSEGGRDTRCFCWGRALLSIVLDGDGYLLSEGHHLGRGTPDLTEMLDLDEHVGVFRLYSESRVCMWYLGDESLLREPADLAPLSGGGAAALSSATWQAGRPTTEPSCNAHACPGVQRIARR